MKKILFAAILVSFMACSDDENNLLENTGIDDSDHDTEKIPLENPESKLSNLDIKKVQLENIQRDEHIDEELVQEVASNINSFSIDMYNEMVKESSGNMFFSPYSIFSALGMAEAGAAGTTSNQMRKALSVTLDGDDFHAALNGLFLSLKEIETEAQSLSLSIANSLWLQDGWTVKNDYLEKSARFYGAGASLLDFISEPEASRVTINTWVEEKTNDLIKDLIPPGFITSDTKLVLTNAIYFFGDWLYSFNKENTDDEDFHKLDDTIVKAPIMEFVDQENNLRTTKRFYAQLENVQILDLPYEGDKIAMTIFLPARGYFEDIENNLTKEFFDEAISRLRNQDLALLKIPSFSFTSDSIPLKKYMQTLGMIDAFELNADFSLITDEDLFITEILHKAHITTNEEGSEAAAATAVIMNVTASTENSTGGTYVLPRFVANRPFIYFIRDKQTQAILFAGRVMDPTLK